MNALGPDGCELEIDTLAEDIVASACKAGFCMTRDQAVWLVQKAIKRSRAALEKAEKEIAKRKNNANQHGSANN